MPVRDRVEFTARDWPQFSCDISRLWKAGAADSAVTAVLPAADASDAFRFDHRALLLAAATCCVPTVQPHITRKDIANGVAWSQPIPWAVDEKLSPPPP